MLVLLGLSLLAAAAAHNDILSLGLDTTDWTDPQTGEQAGSDGNGDRVIDRELLLWPSPLKPPTPPASPPPPSPLAPPPPMPSSLSIPGSLVAPNTTVPAALLLASWAVGLLVGPADVAAGRAWVGLLGAAYPGAEGRLRAVRVDSPDLALPSQVACTDELLGPLRANLSASLASLGLTPVGGLAGVACVTGPPALAGDAGRRRSAARRLLDSNDTTSGSGSSSPPSPGSNSNTTSGNANGTSSTAGNTTTTGTISSLNSTTNDTEPTVGGCPLAVPYGAAGVSVSLTVAAAAAGSEALSGGTDAGSLAALVAAALAAWRSTATAPLQGLCVPRPGEMKTLATAELFFSAPLTAEGAGVYAAACNGTGPSAEAAAALGVPGVATCSLQKLEQLSAPPPPPPAPANSTLTAAQRTRAAAVTAASSDSGDGGGDGGDSTPAIIAAVVGTIGGMALAAVVTYGVVKYRQKRKAEAAASMPRFHPGFEPDPRQAPRLITIPTPRSLPPPIQPPMPIPGAIMSAGGAPPAAASPNGLRPPGSPSQPGANHLGSHHLGSSSPGSRSVRYSSRATGEFMEVVGQSGMRDAAAAAAAAMAAASLAPIHGQGAVMYHNPYYDPYAGGSPPPPQTQIHPQWGEPQQPMGGPVGLPMPMPLPMGHAHHLAPQPMPQPLPMPLGPQRGGAPPLPTGPGMRPQQLQAPAQAAAQYPQQHLQAQAQGGPARAQSWNGMMAGGPGGPTGATAAGAAMARNASGGRQAGGTAPWPVPLPAPVGAPTTWDAAGFEQRGPGAGPGGPQGGNQFRLAPYSRVGSLPAIGPQGRNAYQ
ncbi:hypothetical protein HYH03_008859 [Edaphochlamys debaryana]|uniref:Uncharacterized protein n=1 Tax=Edaphochlamys debaryana TaxID=47281 RepID=A0A835Y2L3_9CHLO|nr:hypothetical protein HYH03_008859 [Edaphochlamys debaryana]|eukprot:KAG2492951.1 hypothetical protein HYH03_008859 [Edaphochlamys debaryana]